MKISMQLTVSDLIRTLRWQAMELAEQAIEKAKIQPEPKKDDKS